MADSHEIYQQWPGLVGITGEWIGETCRPEGDPLHATSDADAAAIVAEHNATPLLIAALRAVLDLHVPLDRGTGPQCQGCATHVTFTPWPCPTVTAIDAALGEDSGQQ